MVYVDGFVIPMKKKNKKAYLEMAKLGGKVWKKHGALDYKECISDDISPKMGGSTHKGFLKMTKLKKDELVLFSFIVFKSKKHRNSVNAKVMKDPLMSPENWKDKPMPFDPKRMAYGGFNSIVDM